MHVLAVLDPEIKNERLYAWAEKANWNDMLGAMRRLYPNRKFIDDLPGMATLDITVPQDVEFKLLKKWAGRDGWIGLEDSIRQTVEGSV
jgi:hypothetical protein